VALAIIGAVLAAAGIYRTIHHNFGGQDQPQEILDAWTEWKAKFRLEEYESVGQHNYRFAVFTENYDIIKKSNANPNNTFKLGLGKFADVSAEEFLKSNLNEMLATDNFEKHVEENGGYSSDYIVRSDDPDSWDWEKEGMITPIKDQGKCGSCWAFSTIGGLEHLAKVSSKDHADQIFSEQCLVDCDHGNILPPVPPCLGCNGGNAMFAYLWTKIKGIQDAASYPYTAKGGKCQFNKSVFQNKGVGFGIPFCSSCLKSAVKKRAVSVGLNATKLQHYVSGIFNDWCSIQANHNVLAVGYGTEDGNKFWRVKNSWSTTWGEDGYFRIARTDMIGPGMCGIAGQVSWPTL
jgi:cathepsin L